MKRVIAIGSAGMAGVALVLACGGGYGDTVHFNDVPDFGVPPPPLVIGAWEESSTRPVPYAGLFAEGDYEARWKQEEARRATAKKAAQQAFEHEGRGEYAAAADAWATVRTNTPVDPAQLAEDAIPAEFARDREEALRQATEPNQATLATYLRLTDRLRKDPKASDALTELKKLADAPETGALRAHAQYSVASRLYDDGKYDEAAQAYETAAGLGGPRQEPALMMAIRATLHGRTGWEEAERADAAHVAHGRELIDRLLKLNPQTRFRASAEGWRLRADYLSGRRVPALQGYLRRLTDTREVDAQVSLLSSIRKVVESLSPEEAKAFRSSVLQDPTLLQPYLDYRLYHTASTLTQLASLVSFANEVLAKKPNAKLSSEVEARLAEIAYLQGDVKRALQYAERSLAEPDGARADLATYVRGAALAKSGLREPAREALAGYETRFKNSYLRLAAVEQRALNNERLGRWADALADYQTLNYTGDLAYLVDVRMTPAQVEAYAREKKDRVWARLAAGYRRLRLGEYDAAATWFESVPTPERRKLAEAGSRSYAWLEPDAPNSPLDRIPDPLTTARELGKLSQDKSAKGLYAYASYFYDRRNLLLYNAAAWKGLRGSLGWGWNEKIATPEDEAARRRHHFEHECLWRARVTCLELAKRYPKDPLAPRALYRAATATRRLANFNPWWRVDNEKTDRYAEAASLLRRVYTEYPKAPLAKNARKYEKVFRQEGSRSFTANLFRAADAE
jgi:hypothetical protein